MLGQQLVKADYALNPDNAIKLLPGMGKVLTQAFIDLNAARTEFMLKHLLEQRTATSASCTRLGRRFEIAEVNTAGIYLTANSALADVMTRADCGSIRQRVSTECRSALTGGQDQTGRISRQFDAVLRVLQQRVVEAVVTHQDRANHLAAIRRYHKAPVAGVDLIIKAVAFGTRCSGVRIANGAYIHTQQLQFGGHIRANKALVWFTH